jgi:hypothetical protein
LTQLALKFEYPKNPASYGTQTWRVYQMLVDHIEVSGKDFLRAFLPEYRRRITDLEELLKPLGYTIRHRREPGNRWVYYSIVEVS